MSWSMPKAPRCPHASSLLATLQRLGPEALREAGERRDTIFMQQGITFEIAGSDGERRDRAWPLDLVARVLPAAEWTAIKRGLAQRIRALNAFVDDVYHAHEIVRAGIVPWSLIVSRPSFARPVHGVRPPGGVYCHVNFVHLGLSLLRHQGIAARYVSGYLFAAGSEPSQESVEVDTHAWLEALLPVPGEGEPVWVGADPTNRGLVGENHVKIGHGRHYADVPPIKGVYRGVANAKLDAQVTMMRLDRIDPASTARS